MLKWFQIKGERYELLQVTSGSLTFSPYLVYLKSIEFTTTFSYFNPLFFLFFGNDTN